ncbi:hypothetical protein GINT2_000482 [Glugoides intestinalis]
MTKRGFYSNHRLIVGRVHAKMYGLLKSTVVKPPVMFQIYDEPKGIDANTAFLQNFEKQPTRMQLLISKAMIKLRQKSRAVMNAGMYCMNTVSYCMGYTFCCILVKKKKHRGILRSVRI